MNEPLVSIIIPVYNTEKYLQNCLKSVDEQTYKNIEVILVDDGSVDTSGMICDNFCDKKDNWTVIHQKNRGLSAARNSGLKKAHGDYIDFVDSDDTIKKDHVKILIELILKTNSDIAICSHEEIYDKKKRNFGSQYTEKIYSSGNCLADMLGEKGFMVSAWGKLYHKKVFRGIKFPEGKLHEDLATTYKTIMKADKIVYTPKPLYCYYQRKGSIVNSGFNKKKMNIIDQTDDMCSDIMEKYPNLNNICRNRKIHARFSVLRLMLDDSNLLEEEKKEKRKIINFLKSENYYIKHSKTIDKRTKIAAKSLMISENVFKLSWKIYEKLFK